MDINKMFLLGMKRELPPLTSHSGLAINLGAGKTVIQCAKNYDFPEWDAEKDPILEADESIGTIHAYHFLEHLPGERVIHMLREFQRVLAPCGVANIVVPYYSSQLAIEDLDHKTQFCEDTWKTMFNSSYYSKHREQPWKLKINLNIIIGINERNLALMTQLEKTT